MIFHLGISNRNRIYPLPARLWRVSRGVRGVFTGSLSRAHYCQLSRSGAGGATEGQSPLSRGVRGVFTGSLSRAHYCQLSRSGAGGATEGQSPLSKGVRGVSYSPLAKGDKGGCLTTDGHRLRRWKRRRCHSVPRHGTPQRPRSHCEANPAKQYLSINFRTGLEKGKGEKYGRH